MEVFNKYKAVIFDLDDTLFPEFEYLKIAYRFVAETISNNEINKIIRSESIYNYLITVFKKEGRNNLYQKMCSEFDIKRFSVDEFLYCLRSVELTKEELKVFPAMKILIDDLFRNNKMLFIVTNGNITQQKNKINSLNISLNNFTEVIFSSACGKEYEKPNPFYLNKILRDYDFKAYEIIFLGDSIVDELASKQAGVNFMNVSSHILKNIN